MSITTDEVFNIREKDRSRDIPCITKDAGNKLRFMSRHTVEYLTYTDAISLIAMNISQDASTESSLMWISSEAGTIDNGDETITYYPFDLIFTKTTNAGISFVSERICNITNNNSMKAVFDEDTGVLTFYYDEVNHEGEGTIYEFGDHRTWLVDTEGVPIQDNTTVTSVVFDKSFENARPRYCNNWFDNMTALESIEGTEYLNTSECLNMTAMFRKCTKLSSLYVDYFDIDKVKSFDYMFNGCTILTRVYSLNTTYWNGDNATSEQMFTGCYKINNCYKAQKITKTQAYVGYEGYFIKSPREVE